MLNVVYAAKYLNTITNIVLDVNKKLKNEK